MGCNLRVVLGLIGAVLGGLIGKSFGAIIGFFVFYFAAGFVLKGIGITNISANEPNFAPPRPNPTASRHTMDRYRFISVWSGMMAKMAKADGVVTPAEIQQIEEFFSRVLRLDPPTRKYAIGEFQKAKNANNSFRYYAREFVAITGNDRFINRQMLDILIRLASVDGAVSPEEDALLREAAQIFGVVNSEYSNMKTSYTPTIDKYYGILGISKTATDDEIKKKYRELVKENHPDVLIGKGMPEDFVTYATKKFQDIQEAYDKIKEERGFR